MHPVDQLLYVAEGRGIIAIDEEKRYIEAGDPGSHSGGQVALARRDTAGLARARLHQAIRPHRLDVGMARLGNLRGRRAVTGPGAPPASPWPNCGQGPTSRQNHQSITELIEQAAASGAQRGIPRVRNLPRRQRGICRRGGVGRNWPDRLGARALARRHGISILLGSLVEAGADGAVHNTSVFVNASGEVAGTYPKIHLFTSVIPEARGSESSYITPGNQLTVVGWGGWNVGLSICFDIRFPSSTGSWPLSGPT